MPKSVRGVMREFKQGALHSGSSKGPVVTNPKQAIAIGLSEQRSLGTIGGAPPKPKAPTVRHDGSHPIRNLQGYAHPRGKKGR
jgi:hypothetical protein